MGGWWGSGRRGCEWGGVENPTIRGGIVGVNWEGKESASCMRGFMDGAKSPALTLWARRRPRR